MDDNQKLTLYRLRQVVQGGVLAFDATALHEAAELIETLRDAGIQAERELMACEEQIDALAAERDALRELERQNEMYRELVVGEGTWQRFQELREDAERYRWLRNTYEGEACEIFYWRDGEAFKHDPLSRAACARLDETIDAARTEDRK